MAREREREAAISLSGLLISDMTRWLLLFVCTLNVQVRRYQPKIPAYLKAHEEEEQQQEGEARASNNTASGLPSSPVRLLSFFDRLQVYDERKRSTMARLAHEAKERDDNERQCTFKPHRFTSERWQLALRQPPPSPRARAERTK